MTVPVPLKYRRELRSATDQAGIPYEVGAEQIDVESGWDPNAVSPAGAEGIAQFEPATWQQYGEGGDPFNPSDAFPAYGRFMQRLMYDENDDLRNSLAAYNAGEGNLQAGYGYADKILAQSGYTGKGKGSGYANPLRDVQQLTPERVDMGVDYSGSGPIYALGPGEITNVYNSGWPGGAFISEKLSSGPLAGHYVYSAENISPGVQVGQKVDSSTKIGDVTGGIETGFAEPPGSGYALGRGQWDTVHSTAYGVAFNQVLTDLGAPSGVINKPVKGEPPWWLKNVGKGLTGQAPPTAGGGGLFGGIESAISDVASAVHGVEEAVSWFTPPKILRTISFVVGSGLVVYGVVALARPRVNLPTLGSTPVVPGGELGPALGIASVTAGAIFLFFAFHNTSATDFQSLLGAIRGRLHGEPIPVQS